MGPRRISVMCVDDHRLVREGVAALVNQEPDMEVIASVATGEEAIVLSRQRNDRSAVVGVALRRGLIHLR